MTPILLKSVAALATVAGLAVNSGDALDASDAYEVRSLTQLTQSDVKTHAMHVFMRGDTNRDNVLDADEYTSLSVVTAELAHLNGFIVIETGDAYLTAPLPGVRHSALSQSEQIRIEAVSRKAFYVFAGDDGTMDISEFAEAQVSKFDQADFNSNGILAKRELFSFAQRQALVALDT